MTRFIRFLVWRICRRLRPPPPPPPARLYAVRGAPVDAHACPDCGADAVPEWYGGRCYHCHHDRLEREQPPARAEREIVNAWDAPRRRPGP